MTQEPLVSVLMTSYNREKYIGQAIESVLASSYTNFEFIIVDDASTDSTVDIAKQYQQKDARISVYINEMNLGDYKNRNRAASLAKGIYLKYLDSDDIIYPYSMAMMVDVMEKNPAVALALSYNIIEDIQPYPRIFTPRETMLLEYFGKSVLSVGPSGTIIRQRNFKDMGGFSGQQYLGDRDLWLRMAKTYSIATLPPALVWWRVHPEQQAQHERKEWKPIIDRHLLSNAFLLECGSLFDEKEFEDAKQRTRKNFLKQVIRTAIRDRELEKAAYLFKKSGYSFADLLKSIGS